MALADHRRDITDDRRLDCVETHLHVLHLRRQTVGLGHDAIHDGGKAIDFVAEPFRLRPVLLKLPKNPAKDLRAAI